MSDLNMIQARDLPLTIRIEGRVVSLLRRGQLVAPDHLGGMVRRAGRVRAPQDERRPARQTA